MNPTLIIIGGIPGTGKSTLAKALSRELKVPVFSKDELEASIVRAGLSEAKDMRGVGYEIMATLARNQIETGNSAIFDFIASSNRVINLWPDLLFESYIYIECICSDEKIHKDRIEERIRPIEGWYELCWDDVVNIKRVYRVLRTDRLVLDSINDFSDNIKLAVEYVSKNACNK